MRKQCNIPLSIKHSVKNHSRAKRSITQLSEKRINEKPKTDKLMGNCNTHTAPINTGNATCTLPQLAWEKKHAHSPTVHGKQSMHTAPLYMGNEACTQPHCTWEMKHAHSPTVHGK